MTGAQSQTMEPARVLAQKYCDLVGATYGLVEPYMIASFLAGVVEQAEPSVQVPLRFKLGLDLSSKAAGYKTIRAEYVRAVRNILDDYLTSRDPVAVYRNLHRRAATEAFFDAFNVGYKDGGGGEMDDQDDEDREWLAVRTDAELGYVGELFQSLKQLRDGFHAEEITAGELRDEVARRSQGYVDGLDMVYAEGKLRGAKNIMLTMVGQDGIMSCRDCQRNKGKRYSARKWLRIGYPPSRDYECKGYQCQHYLENDDGNRFTP